ncbi:MAG: low affinity iron permease family protein [Sphingomicrobium sp.]
MTTTNGKKKSAFERIGCQVSSWVSDLAANPIAQVLVVIICSAWFVVGLKADILTAVLSILAITLTQMVLNRQNEREADAHRRDVALHAKIDELVIAMKGARNEMAGIEDLDEEDIEGLKEDVQDAIETIEDEPDGSSERKAAEQELDEANEKLAAGKARAGKDEGKAPREALSR